MPFSFSCNVLKIILKCTVMSIKLFSSFLLTSCTLILWFYFKERTFIKRQLELCITSFKGTSSHLPQRKWFYLNSLSKLVNCTHGFLSNSNFKGVEEGQTQTFTFHLESLDSFLNFCYLGDFQVIYSLYKVWFAPVKWNCWIQSSQCTDQSYL